MIDRLRALSHRAHWLRPVCLVTAAAAAGVFAYVVLNDDGVNRDVFIIPSMVLGLWSLVCALVLSIFPYVPPQPEKRERVLRRLKIRLVRGAFHLGSWIFCGLSQERGKLEGKNWRGKTGGGGDGCGCWDGVKGTTERRGVLERRKNMNRRKIKRS